MVSGSSWSWSPPAVSGRPVTPLFPTEVRELDATTILDALVASIDGARGAILASVDGFACARSSSMVDEAAHSAMLAAATGLARQLVTIGGGTELRELIVDHDRGLLVLWPIGDGRVLAMLTEAGVDRQRLRIAASARSAWLDGAGAA